MNDAPSDETNPGTAPKSADAPRAPRAPRGTARAVSRDPGAGQAPLDVRLHADGMKDTFQSLNRTLHGIDHELQLLGRTHKYDWISKRDRKAHV